MTEVWLGFRQVIGGVGIAGAAYAFFFELFVVLFRGLPGFRLRWEAVPNGVKWFAGIAEAIFVAWMVGRGFGIT